MIPAIIHQCYFPAASFEKWGEVRDTVLERYERTCGRFCRSMTRMNPEFAYMFWTYDNLHVLHPKNEIEIRVIDYVKSDLSHTLKSDLFRAYCLYKFGGIYADTDFEAMKDFTPLLDTSCFCARERPAGYYASSFMGSDKGNPILLEAMAAMVDTLDKWPNTREKDNACVLGCGFYKTSTFLEKFETIHPTHFFFPYYCTEERMNEEPHASAAEFPESYVVHHWNGMREGGWCREFPIDYSK